MNAGIVSANLSKFTLRMDDSDKCKTQRVRKAKEAAETRERNKGLFPVSGNIFQPSWIRRALCNDPTADRVVLDYGFHFLLPLSILLWAVLGSYAIG